MLLKCNSIVSVKLPSTPHLCTSLHASKPKGYFCRKMRFTLQLKNRQL